MRRTSRRAVGYTPVNPDTSPMVQYSNYHWHYNFPQGMEAPKPVNRTLAVPFNPPKPNVNKFKGVWVDLQIPVAYRVALAPQLERLAIGRTVPKTPVADAVADFEKIAPRIKEHGVRDSWLAKIAQLGGFQKSSGEVHKLWLAHCESRFAPTQPSPPLPLVLGMLFSYAASDNAEWKPFFKRCLKNGWNLTPHFPTSLWDELLRCAGAGGDQEGVVLLLEELLDVHGDIEHIRQSALVWALNAVVGSAEYDYVKKYLFHLSERKVKSLSSTYASLRAGSEDNQLKDNDAMFYHVQWHSSIRQPREFSPRQLYFDYQPSALTKGTHNANAKIDSVVKDKIEKWKQEGLLPESFEYTDKVYDKSAAYKNVMRQEKWKKWPKIVKDEKYGYHGDP